MNKASLDDAAAGKPVEVSGAQLREEGVLASEKRESEEEEDDKEAKLIRRGISEAGGRTRKGESDGGRRTAS